MTVYFVTRHAGALAWANATGVDYDMHLTHLDEQTMATLSEGDEVIGTLPINIVADICAKNVRYWHLSLNIPAHLRGIELDAVQMATLDASLEAFVAKRELV